MSLLKELLDLNPNDLQAKAKELASSSTLQLVEEQFNKITVKDLLDISKMAEASIDDRGSLVLASTYMEGDNYKVDDMSQAILAKAFVSSIIHKQLYNIRDNIITNRYNIVKYYGIYRLLVRGCFINGVDQNNTIPDGNASISVKALLKWVDTSGKGQKFPSNNERIENLLFNYLKQTNNDHYIQEFISGLKTVKDTILLKDLKIKATTRKKLRIRANEFFMTNLETTVKYQCTKFGGFALTLVCVSFSTITFYISLFFIAIAFIVLVANILSCIYNNINIFPTEESIEVLAGENPADFEPLNNQNIFDQRINIPNNIWQRQVQYNNQANEAQLDNYFID